MKKYNYNACGYGKNACYILRPVLFIIFLCTCFYNAFSFPDHNVISTSGTVPVRGYVYGENNEPLPGATIHLKGSVVSTETNSDGMFLLDAPVNSTIIVTMVGYETQEVNVVNGEQLTIRLKKAIVSMDEVQVIAYGSQLKRNVTGAVQTVNNKELKDIPVAQITQKLQGKLAGVQIFQNSGRPGQGMSVRVRGQASISAQGQPLYVVDGLPIVGDISAMNPDEIEDITVLKDAASSSLYGSRAAFGVVLVRTKRAASGQSSLNVNAYYGIQQVPKKGRPDMMNAREFAQFRKEVYEFNNQPVPEIYKDPSQYGEGTNWYDVLLRNAPIQNYSISLASNKDKFSTAATAGFFNQEGVIINTGYKRFSLRLNSEYKFNDRLKFLFNVAPTMGVFHGSNRTDGSLWGQGIIENAILTSPIMPYKNADGTLPLTTTAEGLFPNPNWYRVALETDSRSNNFGILSNAGLEFEIIKDLVAKTTINVDYAYNKFDEFRPSTIGTIFAPPPNKATKQLYTENYYSWMSENTLNYKKTLGDHSFEGLLGYTVQRYRGDITDIMKTDYADDRIRTLSAGATTSYSNSGIEEWSIISYLARVDYNFRSKYLLSAAIRRDGSSRFGSDNKWGNFPSISAGWIISNEPFMSGLNTVSFLKLRGSYGLTGNNNIGNYSYYAAINTSNYVFNGTLANGRAASSIANQMLGWERTKQLDIGLDIGFIKNRLMLSYDYYRKNTDGLLFGVPIPIESGFGNVITNIGAFRFWGHELTINSKNIVRSDFRWTTDFNIAHNDNRVMKLGTTDAPIYQDGSITRVGDRIGQFWGFKFLGIYQNAADLANSPKYPTSEVGTVKMADINGDGKVSNSNDDKTIIGNPWPKFIYGLNNSLQYKNIDFSIVIAGSYGNKIMNRTLEFTQNLDGVFNVTKDVARRWKSEQDPGDGQHPGVKSGTTDLARFVNSRWVTDGSFLTIKNITLGYNVPLKNMNTIRTLRAYAGIQQALVLTKYDGANPEVSDYGSNALLLGQDNTAFPVPRTYTIGINLGL